MGSKAILVIDSDIASKAYVTDVLQYLGWRAEWSNSWEGAVRRLEQARYDAVMIDCWTTYPTSQDCRELITWLREHQHHEPVIVLSYEADLEQWVNFLRHGAIDLIKKPLTAGQIAHALNLAMEKSQVKANPEQSPDTLDPSPDRLFAA